MLRIVFSSFSTLAEHVVENSRKIYYQKHNMQICILWLNVLKYEFNAWDISPNISIYILWDIFSCDYENNPANSK